MSKNFIFSSESVGEGHPDKVCDTISDAVLDACLEQDPRSRVACETYAKSNLVVVGGEITTSAKLDFSAIARDAIMRDPAWQGGHYYGTGSAPDAGMGVARMVGHVTYLSAPALNEKFGRRTDGK